MKFPSPLGIPVVNLPSITGDAHNLYSFMVLGATYCLYRHANSVSLIAPKIVVNCILV